MKSHLSVHPSSPHIAHHPRTVTAVVQVLPKLEHARMPVLAPAPAAAQRRQRERQAARRRRFGRLGGRGSRCRVVPWARRRGLVRGGRGPLGGWLRGRWHKWGVCSRAQQRMVVWVLREAGRAWCPRVLRRFEPRRRCCGRGGVGEVGRRHGVCMCVGPAV
jgi:hypothetical protein